MKANTHKMDHVAAKRAPLVLPGFTTACDYFGRRVRLLEHFLWHRSFWVRMGAGGSHSCAHSHRRRTFSHAGWCLTCLLCQTLFPPVHCLLWATNPANSRVCPPLVNKHPPCIHIVNPCLLSLSLFYLTVCRTCSRWWCRVPTSTRPPLYPGDMEEQQRASSPPAPSKVCVS